MSSVTDVRGVTRSARRRTAWGAWLEGGEPHPVRGPFTRWPRAADSILAVAVVGLSLVAVAVSALDDDEDLTGSTIGELPAPALILLAVASGSLLWRRRHPVAVTGVVLAAMTAWAVGGYGDGQELALVVATYSVGRYTSDQRRSVGVLAVVVVVGIVGTIVDDEQRVDVAPAVIVALAPWYVGRRVRDRGDYLALLRERAERLEAEQQARARQAVVEERAQIARELHDVVAHRVSMMTVQAGAAKTVARDDLDAAVEAMGDVERAGRQALGELRHLLGVLRTGEDGGDGLGPQPGYDDLADLVVELARTGAEVVTDLDGRPERLPAAVDLSAYRIVEESLTNVLKHAGPEPSVRLTTSFEPTHLLIEIENTVADGSSALPRSGYGLAGMRERATSLGGTLTAGPGPPGHFVLTARLPLDPDPA
ncbi:MAG: sensor histidine kinase [Actinomycetota bacterium]